MTGPKPGAHDDRDLVLALLRLAPPFDAVPPERAERVRAASRTQWRRVVRGRRRERALEVAALLATAAAACLAVAVAMRPRPEPARELARGPALRVESLQGAAWSRSPGDDEGPTTRLLGPGDLVPAACELGTAGHGRVALRLPSGHSVRLDRSTTVRLAGVDSLALARGAVYVDSGSGGAATRPLRVHTDLGVVEEEGTQFEVRLEEGSVRVRLREGAVVFRRARQALRIERGSELTLARDGSAVRRPLAAHGEEWAWAAGVAPVPDLDGLTAAAFLEWAARERGYRLVFADAGVARSARETVLSGSLSRLGIDQALAAVLPSCRMTHRLEEGVLRVAAEE